jgi:hypothetical protein
MVKRRFNLPVVLDFQDPWVSHFGARQPRWSKAGLAHRLAEALEPTVLREASFVTSVSETQNAEMSARYPWLNSLRFAAVPIGGDPEDFEALRSRPLRNPQVKLESDRINLTYVGTFLPRAEPLVRIIFKAVARLKAAKPALIGRMRLNFIGTSNQPDNHVARRVEPIAIQEGIGEVVHETPQRVPFLEALSLVAGSTGLLLIGSDEPHYTASKIYPALMSGRPYVSLFHRASSAHSILSAAGGGRAISFASPMELLGIARTIEEALGSLAETPEAFGRACPAAYAPYTAHAVAGHFARVFDQIAG